MRGQVLPHAPLAVITAFGHTVREYDRARGKT